MELCESNLFRYVATTEIYLPIINVIHIHILINLYKPDI